MESYRTQFFTAKSLETKLPYLCQNTTLSVLSWLVQEIKRYGGFPNHIDPENKGEGRTLLVLEGDYYNKWMRDVIHHALTVLPNQKEGHKDLLGSALAMRKILETWKGAKRFKSVAPKDNRYPRYPGIENLQLFREADLTISLNQKQPLATRINSITLGINHEGKACVALNIKYARDGSNWTYRAGVPDCVEKNYKEQAKFLADLSPKDNEIPEETFTRISIVISEATPQGVIPEDWNTARTYWARRKDNQELEDTYQTLESNPRFSRLGGGDLTPDKETKAKFGDPESPYFPYEETNSMLAEILCAPQDLTRSEITCLAQGLRKMRAIGKTARALQKIRESFHNKDKQPELQELKGILAEAKKMGNKVSLRVPAANKKIEVTMYSPKGRYEEGLCLLPVELVVFCHKNKTYSIKGKKNSKKPLKEIREFIVE